MNHPGFKFCPACGAAVRVVVFPALFRPLVAGAAGRGVEAEQEAACFFHPRKQAVAHCAHCGRFLCALCEVEFEKRHFCVECLEAGKLEEKIDSLLAKRTCYDDLALLLAIGPLFFWPLTLITAPAALFVALCYWRKPLSLVRRWRLRFLLAILVALPQVIGWIVLAVISYRGLVS